MSLDDTTPTEYYGPHARRWTNPDTGVTISLSPRDYYRAVAKEQLQREKEVAARVREAEAAAWNDEALDEGVVIIDRLGDPRAAPMAGLFKNRGELIDGGLIDRSLITSDRLNVTEEEAALLRQGEIPNPLLAAGGWNPPEHQRYDLNDFRDMADAAKEAAVVAAFAARSAEASRDKALADAGLPPMSSDIDWNYVDPELAAAAQKIHQLHHATVTDRDDSLGLIRLSTPVVKTPAARHFKRRRWMRIAAKLVLVYIIAVIGVAGVMGVLS